MKVYFFDELMEMHKDQLLDLLSNYIKLRDDICIIMKDDSNLKEYYIQQYLYFYLLNISKIKLTLTSKTEKVI
jgi:hypothetical protein